MIGRDHSYFHPSLRLNPHFIITGFTEDIFCSDSLQLMDLNEALYHELHDEGFEFILFFDSMNMLYCYDYQSYLYLRQPQDPASTQTQQTQGDPAQNDSPSGRGAMTRRNRRRAHNNTSTQKPTELHMGALRVESAWGRVLSLFRSEKKCAFIISNTNSLQNSINTSLVQFFEEFSSITNGNSVVIYIYRETDLARIANSAGMSASANWSMVTNNILLPRINSADPEFNRVISLGSPKAGEIRNYLNYLRFNSDGQPLSMAVNDIDVVSSAISMYAGTHHRSLRQIIESIERIHRQEPQLPLNRETWQQFVEIHGYLPPLQRLNRLIGMREIRDYIGGLYAQMATQPQRAREAFDYSSRLKPLAATERNGYSLNVLLRGNPGTGKTEVASLFGELYRDMGVLPNGHQVTLTTGEITQGDRGGAAIMRDAVQRAIGGVLFIDEAYSLAYTVQGRQAFDQLVADMTRYQGQFAAIIAGYTRDIDHLLQENQGALSRFGQQYIMPDYNGDEMNDILHLMAHDHHLQFSPELEERLHDFCLSWVNARGRGWANGREAENLLDVLSHNASQRALRTGEDESIIDIVDVPLTHERYLANRANNVEEAIHAIDDMIGLTNVKAYLRQLINDIRWEANDRKPGNFLFLGPPGSGKTHIATRIGEIFSLLDVLPRGHVVPIEPSRLLSVAPNGNRHEPQSPAEALHMYVEDAEGGILFIDEAHQLADTPQGRALIRELVPIIENPEIAANTCFICAGYPSDMQKFLNADKGLESRFPANHRIYFENYTAAELVQLTELFASLRGEVCSDGYKQRSQRALEKYLEELEKSKQHFGNARYIRDIYLPDSIKARTRRLNQLNGLNSDDVISEAAVANTSREDRHTLTEHDLPSRFDSLAGPVGAPVLERRTVATRLAELFGKDDVVELIEGYKVTEDKAVFFDEPVKRGLNIAISGPTGSGRHTIASIMAAAWKEYGYLTRGSIRPVSRSSLVAGYVGQTALKTDEEIQEALGGTLLVEYPSTLLPTHEGNDFGPEALGEILGAMSSHQDDLSVILIDSEEGMERLLKGAPELKALINHEIKLDDLSPADTQTLFNFKISRSYNFEPDVSDVLDDFFINWVSDRGGLNEDVDAWGNGVEVDNLITDINRQWKQAGSPVDDVTETFEDGSSCHYQRRHITREMFPERVQEYLVDQSKVSRNAMKELNDLAGLLRVKQAIARIERRVKMNMAKGETAPGNYCFLGNPGSGKTTVAKLMGRILFAAGALKQGHVVSRNASQIANELGRFQKLVKRAQHGILFIDEAHQLVDGSIGNGIAIVKALVTVLEDADVAKDTCIILAGYPHPMMHLISADSGLSSRFGTGDSILIFDDYNPEELLEIMRFFAARASKEKQIGYVYDLEMSHDFEERSLDIFEAVCDRHDPNFGNGRFVRNYLHDAVDEMIERLVNQYHDIEAIPEDVRSQLTVDDIPKGYRHYLSDSQKQLTVHAQQLKTTHVDGIDSMTIDQLCQVLAESVVYLKVETPEGSGEGSGMIISEDGLILTAGHVAKNATRIRARLNTPGGILGDTMWIDCEKDQTIYEDIDMAVIKINARHLKTVSLRPAHHQTLIGEDVLMLGYPLGKQLASGSEEHLNWSETEGKVSSLMAQQARDVYYLDITGLHGNSGSPVFSKRDGRVMGVFSGSITGGQGSLDELNFMIPIAYFWNRFVKKEDDTK